VGFLMPTLCSTDTALFIMLWLKKKPVTSESRAPTEMWEALLDAVSTLREAEDRQVSRATCNC
jgi:hypothetical protein